jgi:hypothetical protein
MSKPHESSSVSARHIEIMTSLDMDQSLVSNKGARVSLETNWKRYITVIKAISKVGDIDWESGKKPTDSEVIAIYTSKSVFYDQSKVFQHVRLYPEMIEWLERSESDENKTTRLWGFNKATFTLKDLETWVIQQQKDPQSDRKGKKKTADKLQKMKKHDDDDEPSSSSKRIHKKSVGGRKL